MRWICLFTSMVMSFTVVSCGSRDVASRSRVMAAAGDAGVNEGSIQPLPGSDKKVVNPQPFVTVLDSPFEFYPNMEFAPGKFAGTCRKVPLFSAHRFYCDDALQGTTVRLVSTDGVRKPLVINFKSLIITVKYFHGNSPGDAQARKAFYTYEYLYLKGKAADNLGKNINGSFEYSLHFYLNSKEPTFIQGFLTTKSTNLMRVKDYSFTHILDTQGI